MDAPIQVIAFVAMLFVMKYIDTWRRRSVLLTGIAIMIAAEFLFVFVCKTAPETKRRDLDDCRPLWENSGKWSKSSAHELGTGERSGRAHASVRSRWFMATQGI
jgi:hypothetical protein